MLTTVTILFHRNHWNRMPSNVTRFLCEAYSDRPLAGGVIRCSGQLTASRRWLSVTERILNIKCAVEKNIGGMARHITSTPVISPNENTNQKENTSCHT